MKKNICLILNKLIEIFELAYYNKIYYEMVIHFFDIFENFFPF